MEAFQVFATLNLVDMMSGPLGRVQAAMAATKGHAAGLGDSMGRLAVSMAPVAAAAGALLGAFGACARSAMDFEESMAEVRKVVDFDSAAEFDAMGKSIQDMSARIPMAASGIADIIAAAGQSGIAKNDLQEFAEQAAKMGVAFDLTGAQAGKMMADWRAGMNLTLPQVYSLGDAVNYLSNHMNATAPALGEVIQRMGATAMACGLTETQVAALGAAFLSAGAAPEVASTALKNFVTTLTQGDAMTKTQITTLKKLGFSAGDLAKGMQKDAEGTMKAVLGAIAALPRENQMSVLTQLFGEESIGAIVSAGFGLLGAAINAVVEGLSFLQNIVTLVIDIFTGNWTGAMDAARGACDSLVSAVMGIADSLGIGDAIRAAFDDVVNFLNSIDLSECGRKILETLKTGILSAAGSIKDAVSGVFDKIGSLLPHSDAKEGPLSTLTLSGQKMMTTLAGGVALGAGTLQGTVSRSLEPIGQNIRTALTDAGGAALPALDTSNITASLTAIQGMTSRTLSIQTPEVPMPDGTTGTEGQQERARQAGDTAAQPRYWTLHIANITLPNVKDANSFYDELRQAATEYGEGLA